MKFWNWLRSIFAPQIQPAADFSPEAELQSSTVAAAKWMAHAINELGVSEISGPKNNPRIVEYHKTAVGEKWADEVPWCSSFVNWVMVMAGYEPTRSALARSWLKWHGGVKLDGFAYGCIVVLSRGTNPAQGHVGFGIREAGTYVLLLGGNQQNRVTEDTYSKSRVLAYVWPKNAPLPVGRKVIG